MDGTIVKISLENFMTYEHVVIKPKRHLNVIIGPNGTGKSTIVCAIILGLGGKYKLVQRGSSLSAFVKSSCDSAKIEIELLNSKGINHVVTRTITCDNKSTWYLNGRSVSQKAVDDLTTSLNIQVDNLCQFLPQDRIADFARMNKQSLLENTIKCVGPPQMSDDYVTLKEFRAKELSLEQKLQEMTQKLNTEEQQTDRLRGDVEALRERNALLEQLNLMKKKHAWLLYHNKRSEAVDMKNDRDEAFRSLNAHKQTYEAGQKNLLQVKAKLEKLNSFNTEATTKIRRSQSHVDNKLEEMDSVLRSIRGHERAYEQRVEDEQRRQKEVNVLQTVIHKLESDLSNLSQESSENYKEDIEKLTCEINKLSNEVKNIYSERLVKQVDIDNVKQEIRNAQREYDKVRDIPNQRLELLRRYFQDAYAAVLWLRENHQLFRCKIYEPLMLEINVKNPNHAKYLENLISNRDLVAFTCEDKDDMNKFLKIVRDEKRLKVNAVHAGYNHPEYRSPPIETISMYGFHSYAIDLFTAPGPIVNYLCKNYKVHSIPIGNDYTYKVSERIPESINLFFSESHRFRISVSKYSREKCTSSFEVSSPKFLNVSMDVEYMQRVEHKLQSLRETEQSYLNVLDSLQGKQCSGEKKLENLRKQKKELLGRFELRKVVQARLNVKLKQFESLEQEKIDLEQEKDTCKKAIETVFKQLDNHYNKLDVLLLQYVKACVFGRWCQKTLHSEIQSVTVKEREVGLLHQQYRDAERLLNAVDLRLKETKMEAKRLFAEAKQMTDGLSPDKEGFDYYETAFQNLNNSLEGLVEDLQNITARIECLGEGHDIAIEHEYQRKQQEIEKLKECISENVARSSALKEEMLAVKTNWLPTLKDFISKINHKFSECFAFLHCAGEVSLVCGQDEDDFEHYGLCIRVKYRDEEELQELNQYQQSGGERAVATAVFLISLQGLAKVPFCAVDEINQGMDAVNERLIFELLVETTSKDHNSQYFVLTPKLLYALFYKDTVNIMCVHNGRGSLDSKTGDLSDMIKLHKQKSKRRN